MKVGIIGAGPAGMTAAYQLSKAGIAVEVFETSSSVGGLAKTIELWGSKVDLGPHRFFSNDRRVNELWLEVVGKDYDIVNRLTRILYDNKFYAYPLKPFNVLKNLGSLEASLCILSYFKEKIFPAQKGVSFEDWVIRRFGRHLFNIFFKSYSEKLWGISCKDLDADFAAQRIKKLSLLEAVKNAFFHSNDHRTLADQFAYPHGGTGTLYQRMANYVNQNGGKVSCNMPVERVITKDKKVVGLEFGSGRVELFDHVISSMPITLLVSKLPEVPEVIKENASRLKFRNTILVYLNVSVTDLFPDQWIYVHSPKLRTGRITNYRNWGSHLFGTSKNTILAMEYWCYDHDSLWNESDQQLVSMAKRELKLIGLKSLHYLNDEQSSLSKQKLIKPGFKDKLQQQIETLKILDGYVLKIKRCYPVYDMGYKTNLKPVQEYLSSIEGLSAIGRYGSFKYNNQDHSILMGLLASENITTGSHHDLWKINTDYENYQEKTVITKTGLEKG